MNNHYCFIGGAEGEWRVLANKAVIGPALPAVSHVSIQPATEATSPGTAIWTLRGFTSNTRYAERGEIISLRARQQSLNRAEATHAALIPIRKNAKWWALAQDERRAIFEQQSHHTAIGLDYLPAIARQLHHSRDLGEPFDFLTWFEFAPTHGPAFDDLLTRLRATPEWDYVEHEAELRLVRA